MIEYFDFIESIHFDLNSSIFIAGRFFAEFFDFWASFNGALHSLIN